MIHPIAADGFTAEAERYDRARPGYPEEAVEAIAALADGKVLDLAAGTGKLTSLLAAHGLEVVAAEPLAEMRRKLVDRVDAVPVVGAIAERLPFAARSFSVVTVAQAFHWFEAFRASAELDRIVAAEGHLVTVTNERLRRDDWQRRLWDMMDDLERDAPWNGADRRRGRPPQPPWAPSDHLTFEYGQPTTVDLAVDRLASTSHVAVLPAVLKRRTLERIRRIAAEAPDPLIFHSRTHVRVWRR